MKLAVEGNRTNQMHVDTRMDGVDGMDGMDEMDGMDGMDGTDGMDGIQKHKLRV